MAKWDPIDWQTIGPAPVIGVDEVGRGCLAGPVYAAAVILPTDVSVLFKDSKLLSASRRAELSEWLKLNAAVSLGFATVTEIIQHNILRATWLAMRRAIEGLGVKSGHVLVDGNARIPDLQGFEQSTYVKGDQRLQPIAAASVYAKNYRDSLMQQYDQQYPGYGFAEHKGYSTETHRAAIARLGPCLEHRLTFAGVREHVGVTTARVSGTTPMEGTVG